MCRRFQATTRALHEPGRVWRFEIRMERMQDIGVTSRVRAGLGRFLTNDSPDNPTPVSRSGLYGFPYESRP